MAVHKTDAMTTQPKPRIGVYKFSSCDGCQLAFLNSGPQLIALAERVDLVHFVEAGINNESAEVDIAFIEGSVSTPAELERIKKIRRHSQYLITIGACATSGGLQALRNGQNIEEWMRTVYASPEFIETLETATAIARHVKVDCEIWGCPVSTEQVYTAIKNLLIGVTPKIERESVCMECKRQGNICILVTQKIPCLGPVTKTGCGALCPSVGRGCYGCYGPKENTNTSSLSNRFVGFGLMPTTIAKQFAMIYSQEEEFRKEKERLESPSATYSPPEHH